MRKISLGFYLFLNLTFCSCATTIRSVASETFTSSLQDVSYSFDQTKLATSQDAFHFLRSFVDYFYLLIAQNQKFLAVSRFRTFAGFCVGDAHPENFGVLLQKGATGLFTMNDLDDAGPCPLADDLLRLMTASVLYRPDVKTDDILKAYLQGLENKSQNPPQIVSDLINKAEKKGEDPDPKRISGGRFVRGDGMNEVSGTLAQEIRTKIQNLFPKYEVIDIVQTSKVGGGSGGLTRFEILLRNQLKLRHIELKQEIRPSIYPVATSNIPSTQQRLQLALSIEQGEGRSPFYNYLKIGEMDMLVRPRFDGNVGVNLEKQSPADNKDLIIYEAYVLGTLHRKSVADLQAYLQAIKDSKAYEWASDTDQVSEHMRKKYQSLIHQSTFSSISKAKSQTIGFQTRAVKFRL